MPQWDCPEIHIDLKGELFCSWRFPSEDSETVSLVTKWKQRSHYRDENRDKNLKHYVDVVREAIDSTWHELESAKIRGPVHWRYSGPLVSWLEEKLKAIPQFLKVSIKKEGSGTLVLEWFMIIGSLSAEEAELCKINDEYKNLPLRVN